jgi:hypothetical protein
MSIVLQKAHTLLWYSELESARDQHEFRRECGVRTPDDKNIRDGSSNLESLALWIGKTLHWVV